MNPITSYWISSLTSSGLSRAAVLLKRVVQSVWRNFDFLQVPIYHYFALHLSLGEDSLDKTQWTITTTLPASLPPGATVTDEADEYIYIYTYYSRAVR